MMSYSPEAEGNGPGVVLRYITPEALDQFGHLSRANQRLVAKAAIQPLARNRYQIIEAAKKKEPRVYYLRASGTLRISFCLNEEGEGVIVHIGTHAEFDHFARNCDVSLSHNLIPLAETRIMAATKPDPSPAASDQNPVEDRIRTAFELAGEAVRELIQELQREWQRQIACNFVKPVDERLQKLERTVADTAKKAEGDVAQIQGALHEKDAQLEQRIAQADSVCRDLSSQVQGLRTDLDYHVSTNAGALEQARRELNDKIDRTAADARQYLESALARLASEQAADRDAASQKVHAAEQRLAEAERRMQSAEDQLCQWGERFRSVEEQAQRTSQQLGGVAASAQADRDAAVDWRRQCEQQLAGLLQAIDGLAEQVAALFGALKDLRTSHEQMEPRIAELASRWNALRAAEQRRLGYRLRGWLGRAWRRVLGRFGRPSPKGDTGGMTGQP